MNRPTLLILACSITMGAMHLTAVVASQPGKLAPGARVAVVAFHDSRLLTLCPVIGQDVVESNIWTSKMTAKVTVAVPPVGFSSPFQNITLHLDRDTHTRMQLPWPAESPQGRPSGRPAPPASSELDRLARDIEVERRLAERFRARKTYVVVDSPAEADFVFVAESNYVALSIGTAEPPRATIVDDARRDSPARIFRDAEDEWNRRMDWQAEPSPAPTAPQPRLGTTTTGVGGGDRRPNWRESILAVAVPAALYRQHAGDGSALTAAGVWTGLAAAGWQPTTREGRTMAAASPEALVDQFHTKGSGLPDYLPMCAATAGTIRSIHDPVETVGVQPAGEPALPRPAAERAPDVAQFRSIVTLVMVPVTVTDSGGQVVRDLPVSAFHVFEDDVEQKVERLEPGSVPTDIALLIDTSMSMYPVRKGIMASASACAGALRANDRVMVVMIHRWIRVLSEFTEDRSKLQGALAQIRGGAESRLYDALALVAVDRLNQVEGRKAVILVTDGIDTRSQLTDPSGALAAMESSNTPVYIIRYEPSDIPIEMYGQALQTRRWLIAPDSPEKVLGARAAANRFLAQLSSGTGGRLYEARPDAALPEMLAHIASELSNQVVLGYYPARATPDGTYRRIRVTVDRPEYSVRARTGYRAGVAQGR